MSTNLLQLAYYCTESFFSRRVLLIQTLLLISFSHISNLLSVCFYGSLGKVWSLLAVSFSIAFSLALDTGQSPSLHCVLDGEKEVMCSWEVSRELSHFITYQLDCRHSQTAL